MQNRIFVNHISRKLSMLEDRADIGPVKISVTLAQLY